ncbi:MAG: cation diffusion facilitator family transporter [Methanosarcinaceae archaeon]|nr:cation diffusion facilitator family transporter [Methanosarcinaceae archaeon]
MKSDERLKRATRTTYTGLIVNLALTAFKLFAGIVGNSAAMLADAIHSFSDLITDFVVILGLRIASKPEDRSHNYGHGKVETLCTVFVALVLFAAGVQILFWGMGRLGLLLDGYALEPPGKIALFAAILSILSKEALYRYTRKKALELKSDALLANAWHHRTDALSSGCAALGIGTAVLFGGKWVAADPLTAVFLSLVIFETALKIFYKSLDELIEASLDEESKHTIEKIIRDTGGILSFHGLKTRKIGNSIAVEACIKVDASLNIREADRITDLVENRLKESFGEESYILIKAEPVSGLFPGLFPPEINNSGPDSSGVSSSEVKNPEVNSSEVKNPEVNSSGITGKKESPGYRKFLSAGKAASNGFIKLLKWKLGLYNHDCK